MASTARIFRNGCRALMSAAKTSVASTTVGSAAAKASGCGNGIFKTQPVSPALRQFIGAPKISRTDAIKKVWDYVKSENLQNPNNKREIYCDEKLKTIFEGKEKVGFTEIAKLLSKHFGKAA